jgi:hypothetical protein
MLQEELQHGLISDCLNQVETAILMSSNHRERGSDSDSTCNQDLVVIPDDILVGTWKGPLDPDGADRVSLKKFMHSVVPVTSPLYEHLSFIRIVGVLKEREGMPLMAIYPWKANVGITSIVAPPLKSFTYIHTHLLARLLALTMGIFDCRYRFTT